MKFVTVLAVVAVFVTSSLAQTWFTNPANGHQYAELTPYQTWSDAEVEASSFGGHLATIRNSSENEWLRSTFFRPGFQFWDCWIGLSEDQPWFQSQRTWSWASGEQLGYTHWGDGEPSSGGEHYVGLDQNGWWRDYSSPWPPPTHYHAAVVEVVPEPGTVFVLGLGALALIRKRK